MLRVANQRQPESEKQQDTTTLLLRIHSIADHLLSPFSSSDPPSPAGAHLRTGVAPQPNRPKEANSQDTIRPSTFTPTRQHTRSYQQQPPANESDEFDPIAIWVSLSPCRQLMNITLFEGWRIVIQVPVRDWEQRVYTPDDVKRAALICMGRQLMGEKVISVPIDVKWDFDAPEEDIDPRGTEQFEEDEDKENERRPSTDSESRLAIHTRRPSAPEPYTPDASSAENGHSPLESAQLHAALQPTTETPRSRGTSRLELPLTASYSSTWSSSPAASSFVTAPDHSTASVPSSSESYPEVTPVHAVVATPRSPTGIAASPRRTSWVRAHFPRIRARRLLPKLNGAFGRICRWALQGGRRL